MSLPAASEEIYIFFNNKQSDHRKNLTPPNVKRRRRKLGVGVYRVDWINQLE